MKKLHFEAPEGWSFTYNEGYEDGVDENGGFVESVYVERLNASNRDGSHSFQVIFSHDCPPIGANDIIEEEVFSYLINSGFVMPEYLKPSPEDLIGQCVISGFDTYYYLIQKPEEENADIRMILETPDNSLVFIDASISDWRDENLMIVFLEEHLSIR